MTNKQLAQAEKERAEKRAKAQAEWLRANGAWNWKWPGSGDEGDLPRNCWNTNLPGLNHHQQHANAVKCNFTPLPGQANKRHKRRQRALAASSYRKA